MIKVKNAIFLQKFWQKYFKNHNSDPWSWITWSWITWSHPDAQLGEPLEVHEKEGRAVDRVVTEEVLVLGAAGQVAHEVADLPTML
jgi:hypothetical protein